MLQNVSMEWGYGPQAMNIAACTCHPPVSPKRCESAPKGISQPRQAATPGEVVKDAPGTGTKLPVEVEPTQAWL